MKNGCANYLHARANPAERTEQHKISKAVGVSFKDAKID
jgi:hypothetical protein